LTSQIIGKFPRKCEKRPGANFRLGEQMQFLLGDIGGTNARFALLTSQQLGQIKRVTVADYPTVGDAIAAFLSRDGSPQGIVGAFLAVAGPTNGERCAIVNSSWIVDGAALRASFGFSTVRLINDFEALAFSLPRLTGSDIFSIGGGVTQSGEPMLVLGPGTGFGAAGVILRNGHPVPIATEGGHATLPSSCPREDAIIEHLRQRFGHVSIERAVSGPGLENLYQAIVALDRLSAPTRNAIEITEAALKEDCTPSRMALETFCTMLGTVAGNFALTFRAGGGVYIAGGIAPLIADVLAQSEFRARFENKGRFREYLERIPTSVIMSSDATFRGLVAVAETIE
jgi:glucokinase